MSNFMPTYLKYEYIFVFISILGRIRIRIFFSSRAGSCSGSIEKNVGSSSLKGENESKGVVACIHQSGLDFSGVPSWSLDPDPINIIWVQEVD